MEIKYILLNMGHVNAAGKNTMAKCPEHLEA